jgi:hypothetical protein
MAERLKGGRLKDGWKEGRNLPVDNPVPLFKQANTSPKKIPEVGADVFAFLFFDKMPFNGRASLCGERFIAYDICLWLRIRSNVFFAFLVLNHLVLPTR